MLMTIQIYKYMSMIYEQVTSVYIVIYW